MEQPQHPVVVGQHVGPEAPGPVRRGRLEDRFEQDAAEAPPLPAVLLVAERETVAGVQLIGVGRYKRS